jgi:flagellum-specific peptidoglycan hydrolase FlgJ
MKLKLIMLIMFIVLMSSNVIMNKTYSNVQFYSGDILYSEVYYQLVKNNIKFPNIVFAQCLIETGYFTSDLFYNQKNLFGMKQPRIRETKSVGISKSGYATYNTWVESIEDYRLWQQSVLKNKQNITEEEYLELLSRIYAEDKKYINKIKSLAYD